MALGMSYEQFWDGDCEMVKAFRRAQALRAEQENHRAWWQGFYIYNAIAACLSDKKHRVEYPKQPFALTGERKPGKDPQTVNNQKAKSMMEIWAFEFNRRMAKKRGETDAG